MTKWIETPHTKGWWELKAGRKTVADIRRVFPKKTKSGAYRFKHMVITQWGIVDGLPGMKGPTFNTLKAAKSYAEEMCK